MNIKNTILLIILFLSNLKAEAQNTILWSVKSPSSDKTSFLLGTLHQMGNSFVDGRPQIKQALLASDLALFESVDSTGTVRALLNKRNEDFTYERHLKKSDIEFLKVLSSGWGVPLSKFTPIELLITLNQEYTKTKCGSVKPTDTWSHFDNYLIHIARTNQVKVTGLESDSLQTNDINTTKLTWQQAEKPIHEWVVNLKKSRNTNRLCRNVRDYMNMVFDYQFAEKCGNNITLKGRNEKWMQEIIPSLERNKVFIAVGLLHLYGDCGLIMQLREKGYLVTPVSLL